MAGTGAGAPVAVDAAAFRCLQNAEVMLHGAYMRVHDARVAASLSASPVAVDLSAAASEASAAAAALEGPCERVSRVDVSENGGQDGAAKICGRIVENDETPSGWLCGMFRQS